MDNIVGTSGNDTIVGSLSGTADTFSAGDNINGGAGTDTLKVTDTDGGVNTGIATITAVENVEIVDAVVTAADFAHDLSGVTNLASVTISKDNNAAKTTTVQGLASTVAVTLNEQTDGTVALTYSDAGNTGDQTASITYIGGKGSTGTDMTAAGIEVVNLTASGSDSDVGDLTFAAAKTVNITANAAFKMLDLNLANAATTALNISGTSLVTATSVTTDGALKTVTVTGSAGYTQGDALGAAVTSVDASGTSGKLNVISGANTTAIKGGSGDDTISVAAIVYSGTAAVDAGAGTDTLVLGADEALTSATAANLKNFEVARVTGDADGETYDLSLLTASTIGAVELVAAASTTVSNLNATQAGAVTLLGDATTVTLNVKDATNPGTADTVTLTLDNTTADTDTDISGDVVVAGVETLNIVSKGNAASTATDGSEVNTVAGLAGSTVLKTINISGDTAFSLDIDAAIVVDKIVNTNTKKVTVDVSDITANGVSYTGADAVDTFIGTANVDIVSLGGGNDVVTAGVGADQITLGTGRDTINVTSDLTTGTVVNHSSTTAFDKISGFGVTTSALSSATLATFEASGSTVGGAEADLLKLDFEAAAADQALAVEANGTGAGQAANTTYTVSSGILTLSGSGAGAVDTLTEWLTEAAAVAGTAGDVLAFQFNGNTYVFGQNGAEDMLVELTGVTGVQGLIEIGAVGVTSTVTNAILFTDIV